eukprot:m.1081659 g.1081659  ORF g.1081659 m.1081659 type:complete len:130 (+) comp24261_c1_seq31:621-1010(+)
MVHSYFSFDAKTSLVLHCLKDIAGLPQQTADIVQAVATISETQVQLGNDLCKKFLATVHRLQDDFELLIKTAEEQGTTSAASVSSFEHGIDAALTAQAAAHVKERIDEALKGAGQMSKIFPESERMLEG